MSTKDPRRITRHCWTNGPLTDDGCGTTCMLERDHKGDHEWSRDDEISITFPALPQGEKP